MEAGTPNAVGLSTAPSPTGSADAAALRRQYAALRAGTLLIDRNNRPRATFSGATTADVLTGLVTNDVLSLSRGQGQYAAVLTPKGKVVADIRIFAREGDFLVDAAPRAAAAWWGVVRKFVNPRTVKYVDVAETLHDAGMFGIGSRALLSTLLGVADSELAALAPYGHRSAESEDGALMVTRVPDLGLEGYDVFGTPSAIRSLITRAAAQGATLGEAPAFNVARIEAGRPEWGVDMDDSTLPQEANLDVLHAISYTKGCYTGQETVARVHFRGHVNRHLRGIRFDATNPPPFSAELIDAGGRTVGDVRSVAMSPRLGGVGLAMVRREVEPGGELIARWADGSSTVSVLSLPFPL